MKEAKKPKLIRKSIVEIKLECEFQWLAMPFLADNFDSLEDYQEFEIARYTEANLIKGTKSNKAVLLINAINENKESLKSKSIDTDKIANLLNVLNKSVIEINKYKESMKIISKHIGYNFRLLNLNWNSETIAEEVAESKKEEVQARA